MIVKNWSAKRSGAAITVVGVERRPDGEPGKAVKITDVVEVRPEGAGSVVAVMPDGATHQLV